MSGVFQTKTEEEEIDRTLGGARAMDEESSEEEEEEESDEDKPDETGFITPADRWGSKMSLPLSQWFVCGDLVSYSRACISLHSGLITPGGFSSVPAGMETPNSLN